MMLAFTNGIIYSRQQMADSRLEMAKFDIPPPYIMPIDDVYLIYNIIDTADRGVWYIKEGKWRGWFYEGGL